MKEIIKLIEEFRIERKWDETDNLDNLIKSIVVESGELLENIQWGEESINYENIKEELADILIYSFTLANYLELDIETIIKEKLEKNLIKYPVNYREK